MCLRRFCTVMRGVMMVTGRCVSVMCSRFVIAGLVVFAGLAMMASCVLMMLGR
jgi:hypothetical protein